MKKYISFSGGVESSTMAILYGKGAKLIWVDTGAEHQELYDRIDLFEKYILDLHKGDTELIRLKGSYTAKGVKVNSLIDAIRIGEFMPSGKARFCTSAFKIKPIDKYLKSLDKCELMIGFNLDEEGRTGNLEQLKNVNYTYPLINDVYTRSDCEAILEFHNIHPNFPPYMNRGGCKMCFYKSEKEYKAMYYLNNKEFNEVKDLENQTQKGRDKHFSIMTNKKPMSQVERDCMQELPFDFTEIYKDRDSNKSCGAFCRR